MRRVFFCAVAPILLLGLVGTPACKRHNPVAKVEEASAPLVVNDSSDGLLLTWIDEKGDFHIVEKVKDVPLIGRDVVRVVDPVTYDVTHPERIFVADLRTAAPDGSYPVRVEPRATFDGLAEARRSKNGLTLSNAAAPPSSAPQPASPSGASSQVASAGRDPNASPRPAVILYGASWCGACHQAAAYLKRKGIAFIEKDIEEDANAAREMQSKLAHAGMHGGSIPVLDVRGKIMIGFNPQEVDSALGAAL